MSGLVFFLVLELQATLLGINLKRGCFEKVQAKQYKWANEDFWSFF